MTRPKYENVVATRLDDETYFALSRIAESRRQLISESLRDAVDFFVKENSAPVNPGQNAVSVEKVPHSVPQNPANVTNGPENA